ncbi:MAG TPA: response regulator [Bacteroidota bacterium]|nr:response regulator [Bacteroidota bacterium]
MTNQNSDSDLPRLLIVEDEPEQRETLAMLFEGDGYSVRATDSAETAMEIIRTTHPHLVITDVKLPGMDGITFFESVRGSKEGRSIPFIFMTAYNDLAAIEHVKQMGSVDYITKPFNLEALVTLVREKSRH